MNLNYPTIEKAFDWLERADGTGVLSSSEHCETRDVFEGRLIRMASTMARKKELEAISSIAFGIVGELGNNAFDHNIGKWRDEPGVYYVYDLENRFAVIADRGQGVLASLKRIRATLKNESEAVELAFRERISGRAPESRGNGLKFVEKNVLDKKFQLYFSSGDAVYVIPNHSTKKLKNLMLKGVIAVLFF